MNGANSDLSDCNVLELGREREYTEELNLTERGLEQLIICGHGLVGDVVVAGNATKVSHLGQQREREREGSEETME